MKAQIVGQILGFGSYTAKSTGKTSRTTQIYQDGERELVEVSSTMEAKPLGEVGKNVSVLCRIYGNQYGTTAKLIED